MKNEFFWINRVNGVEFHGPHPTAQAARDHAIKVYTKIQDGMALAIDILQVVEQGHIETVQSPVVRWVSDSECGLSSGTKGHTLRFSDKEPPKWDSEFIYDIKAEQAQRERKVPRITDEQAFKPVMEQGVNNEERERGIFLPWQIDRATFKKWGEGSAVWHAAMREFYSQVTPDVFRLEPHVESEVVLDYFVNCYSADSGWGRLLRIDLVPPELRECYSNLRPKCNAVEHGELPEWQRAMYVRSDDDGRYKLRDEYAGWCVS